MSRTFNNFADAAKALGFRPKKHKAKPEEIRKCRRCGGNMHLVEGTNIFVCEGKDGEECPQYSIRRVIGFNGKGNPAYIPRKRGKQPS